MQKDNEGSLGKNPYPQELTRIFTLPPLKVDIGLGQLLNEKRLPFLVKPDSKRTDEEEWQLSAYNAIGYLLKEDLFEYVESTPVESTDPHYQEAVTTAIDLMRFVGFEDEDLTTEGLHSAVERANSLTMRGEEPPPISPEEKIYEEVLGHQWQQVRGNLAYQKMEKANERLRKEVKELKDQNFQNRYGMSVEDSLAIEDMSFIYVLAGLQLLYDKFPSYGAFMKDEDKRSRLFKALAAIAQKASSPLQNSEN